jgi:hypothetical protein
MILPPGQFSSIKTSSIFRLNFSFDRIMKLCIGFSFLLSVSVMQGQVLSDSVSLNLIKRGIDYVYNFQFGSADRINAELEKLYPGHPIVHLYRGMITYWENYPLLPVSGASESFEADMKRCIELCEENEDPEYEAEILLENLCARGLLLLYYTENELSFEVFPIAKSTYQNIRRSFDFTSSYTDLKFFTGIYNYYREAYPEAHPVYKTLAFLFPRGDKEKGLNDLEKVARSSILMKAESYSFLTDIYLSFENNYQKATHYSKNLHILYPENPEYLGQYIKNLLLIKNYEEAEKVISSSATRSNIYLQAQISIFKGIIQEKKYHNLQKAAEFYNSGIRNIARFREYGNEFAAFAYFGLSRIARENNDEKNEKLYRRLALKLTAFKEMNFDE